MANRITMTDVARTAGVSLMTVSRVVNNKEDVSPQTRQRVREVIESLGYRPSGIARGLVTQHTTTLGLVVPDIDNPFFSGLVHGAENTAYAEGYSVFLGNSNEDPQRELALLRSLDEKMVDGVILCSSRLPEDQLRREVERFPSVVLISRKLDEVPAATLVLDDEAGGYMATGHLLKQHRAIGFLPGPPVSFSSQKRLLGYRRALDAAGVEFNPAWVRHCTPVVAGGYRAARALLQEHAELSALFCHNDLVAVGALQAAAELGRAVPGDLAIVGYDDIPLAALVSPPLTTCRVNRQEMGTQAMRILLGLIREEQPQPVAVQLAPQLIIRQSAP